MLRLKLASLLKPFLPMLYPVPLHNTPRRRAQEHHSSFPADVVPFVLCREGDLPNSLHTLVPLRCYWLTYVDESQFSRSTLLCFQRNILPWCTSLHLTSSCSSKGFFPYLSDYLLASSQLWRASGDIMYFCLNW